MKKAVLAFFIGILCTAFITNYNQSIETALADSVIRLHVIANSDREHDQALKLKVRDAILEEFGSSLDTYEGIDYSRAEIEKNLEQIEKCAKNVIETNGYDYDVKASLGQSDFPTKSYGDVTLPAGSYEALKVEIGKADGKNWWCVMFPPLCFVDGSCVEVPDESEEYLKSSLGDETYEMITKSDEFPVEFKFKAYEIWQNGKQAIKKIAKK